MTATTAEMRGEAERLIGETRDRYRAGTITRGEAFFVLAANAATLEAYQIERIWLQTHPEVREPLREALFHMARGAVMLSSAGEAELPVETRAACERLREGLFVEWRGRFVAPSYPARHHEAQATTTYTDFSDGERSRISYGAANDRYPGGITYATREDIDAFRAKAGFPPFTDAELLEHPIRTDRRCADCDVEVGEYHLIGCHNEVCPKCFGQAIACGCGPNGAEDYA